MQSSSHLIPNSGQQTHQQTFGGRQLQAEDALAEGQEEQLYRAQLLAHHQHLLPAQLGPTSNLLAHKAIHDDQGSQPQARLPSAGAQRSNQRAGQASQPIRHKAKQKKNREDDEGRGAQEAAGKGKADGYSGVPQGEKFQMDQSREGQGYPVSQQQLLDASNLSMRAMADELQQLLAQQPKQHANLLAAHQDAAYLVRENLTSANALQYCRIYGVDGRESANLNEEEGTGSLERIIGDDHDLQQRQIIKQEEAMATQTQGWAQGKAPTQKRLKVSGAAAQNQSNSKVNSHNKKKEGLQYTENAKDPATQGLISLHDRSAFAANLSSASSHHEQFAPHQPQLLLTAAGKLQKITAKAVGHGNGLEGKKDTSRTKGARETSIQKRSRDANGLDRAGQAEPQAAGTAIPTKKSKSQSNQNTIVAPGHQQSTNRRKVSGPHGNQKKQFQLLNARAQQQMVAQLQQQHLDNPMLIKNLDGEERSHDESVGLALQQLQEQGVTDQTQLLIKCSNTITKAPAGQQPPTSKGSTKCGAQRANNAQNFKLNEFSCLIGKTAAAPGKQQAQSQSHSKAQPEQHTSLEVAQLQHDATKRQHIILTKGQIANATGQNVTVGQATGKKGQVQQARVQSGHPMIKASKVTKRTNLQMAGSNQQFAGQKMNLKQQLQNTQTNNNCVFMILKQPNGKGAKSSQHGRGNQQVSYQGNTLVFNQTGKLMNAEAKADPTAPANAKVKFNRTHGHQDNQFLIQNLKPTHNLSPSVTKPALAEGGLDGSALEQQPEHSRNKIIHTTVSDSMSRRGNTGLASQPQGRQPQPSQPSNKNEQQLVFAGGAASAGTAGRPGRSLGLQPQKMQKHNQLSKQGISSTEAGNVEMICNSQEYIEPSTVLNINRLDFAEPQVLNIGPAVLENTGLLAPGPGALFAQAHGPSSATNKVKKAFEFEIEAQQQLKTNKREKKNLLGAGSTNQASANHTADTINVGGRKAVSTNKKVNNLLKMQQQNVVASTVASKKINLQKPKTFIKTQMNLTGPLPKHMLSPGPYTNKSKLKTKHSQYFDNSSEIDNHAAPQASQIAHAHDYASQQQQLARNFNSSQHFQQPALLPHQAATGAPAGPAAPRQPHQFQVQVHGIGQNGAPMPSAQHQITTQGGSTVININIDSNGWGQPPSIRQTSYQTQQQRQLMTGPGTPPGEVVLHDTAPMTNINLSAEAQHEQPGGAHPQQSQVSYMPQPAFVQAEVPQGQGRMPLAQPVKRQTSSKLRQNDSVSSNKSRRHGQGSNNRRSSSSSHVQNQIQNQMAHAAQYQQHQQNYQYMTAASGHGNNFGELPASHYNFQSVPATVAHPHSNTQIISQNIAKINEKLLQQQHQQNLMVAEHSRDSGHKVAKDHVDQNLSYRVDQLNNSKILAPSHASYNANNQTQIIKSSDLSRIDLQNQRNLIYQGQQKKNSTTLVMNQLQMAAQGKQAAGASGNARTSNVKLLSQTQLVTAALGQANRNDLQVQQQAQSHPFPTQAMSAANGMAAAAGASFQSKHPSLQVQTFQVIPKKIIRQGVSHAVGTPMNAKQSQKQLKVVAAGQGQQVAAATDYSSNTKKQPSGARSTGPALPAAGTTAAAGQPSKLAMKKAPGGQAQKRQQDGQYQNVQHVYESASQISSARFQSATAPANVQVQRGPNQQLNGKKASVSMVAEAGAQPRQLPGGQQPEEQVEGQTGDDAQHQLAKQAQEKQVASMGNLQTCSKSKEASYDQQAEYDQHVRNLENQIQQDQIRLRNELAQMRKVQNSSKQPQQDDQMDEMQMDVDNEDVGNNLDAQVLSMLDQQMLLQQPFEDGSHDGTQLVANSSIAAEAQFTGGTTAGGTNSGLHQYNQIRQQAALVSLENSQIQYMTSFNNSVSGGMNAALSKNYKTNASSSQKNRQYQAHQSLTAATGSNSASAAAHAGPGAQNNRNATHSGSVQRRQPSHEDSTKIHVIEGSGGQSIRQGSQLRVSQHQMANQSSASRGATSNKGGASNTKGKGNNNRSTAISFKGSNMSNRSRSKAGRGSKFNQRISTGKYNFEDINIDIEARHQLLMDSSLGLAAAVQSFGTKKSVTTKNQNISNKLHTQNVQSLLREAKREMLCDGADLDQIYVGGDDVTLKNTKKKRINFNGSQNLALGPQINNFGFQQQRLNIKFGISPKSNSKKLELPSHASMMQYNLIAANANAKSSGNNVTNLQLSDYRTSNNALSQASQPQALQAQRSSLKQPSQQAQDGGSVMSRKQMLQQSTSLQQSSTATGQAVQNAKPEAASNDHLGSQSNPAAPHLQSADDAFAEATNAYATTSTAIPAQSQVIGQPSGVQRSMFSSSASNQAAAGMNQMAPQLSQPSSQYSSVIMNSASGTSQPAASTAKTGVVGAGNGAHTFGLGQLNYLGNKIIKPTMALPSAGGEMAQAQVGRAEMADQPVQSAHGYPIQFLQQQQDVQADARQFNDADMDMDNAIEEVDAEREGQENDGESMVQGAGESLYVNNVGSVGGHADGQLLQSHAFSLAQDPSQIGSGPARPTTMHSLQLVDLTEMTEEVLEEAQQPDQLVQYNEPGAMQYYEQPQMQMLEELQAQQQNEQQQMQRESQAMLQSQEDALREQKKKLEAEQPELPLSGAKVLKHYLKRPGLTEYEKSEILDYKACFFLGIGAEKIKGSKHHQFNCGYDDERGDYNVVLKDHIAYRFEVLDFLGKGSFGQALKCVDHKTGEIVAIKIIRNKKKFQHQAGVELKILLHLKENDPEDTNNIIRIKDYCMFRKHLIISFELFSINLYEFIRNNNFEGVSLSLIRRFAIQILQALKYLREESLIHCDLKPENILLKSPDKSGIKVIDFGSSCFAHERIYTYIQSRFYRAPEIILGIPYTTAIDMWSFGCILTELFTGVPLFPGESEQEQLSLIMEVIGLPARDILAQASRKSVFFDEQTNEPYLSRDSQGNLRIPSSKPLDEVLMCQSDSFHDFITKCLEWDPEKRITPFDALMHEWIIEGLPDQVLIHHKKMLGIYESETEANTALNNQSHSLLDTSVQDADNIADVSGLHGAASPSQQAANSSMQPPEGSVPQSSSGSPSHSQPHYIQNSHLEQEGANQAVVLDGEVAEDERAADDNQEKRIDFYGQRTGEQVESFEDRYESILMQGADNGTQPSAKHVAHLDMSKNILLGQDQFEMNLLKNGYQIAGANPNAIHKGKEHSRSGAKQENFIKTGKQNFKEINQKLAEQREQASAVQSKPFGQQVYHANKSDMAEEEPIHDDFMAAEMQAAIGNPNINRLITQDKRGIPHLPPNSGSNLSGYEVKGSKRGKKNPLLGGILLADANDSSQTGNIKELLQQVNKKSKSTKHQNILLPGSGLHYGYGLGGGNVGPEQQMVKIDGGGQAVAKEMALLGDAILQPDPLQPLHHLQYGNCFSNLTMQNQLQQNQEQRNISLTKVKPQIEALDPHYDPV